MLRSIGEATVRDRRRFPPLTAFLAASAALGTAKRIAILRLEPHELLGRYGSDDMFYYTEVARHVGVGRGLSFDGVHVTSGVQPLWLLLLAPWAPLFEGHPTLALRIDLALVTALTLLSGLVMPRVVRAVMGSRSPDAPLDDRQVHALGTLAGCIWLLHPRMLRVTFEGTEGALAALCWQMSVLAWAGERSGSGGLRLGATLGIGTLARIDHLALLGALFARPREERHSPRRTARILLPVVAAWGSWLLFCAFTTGSVVADSGAAKRLAQERYDSLDRLATNGRWVASWHEIRRVAQELWELCPLLFHTGRHMSRFSIVVTLLMTLSLAITARHGIRQSVGTGASLDWRQAIARAAPTTTAVCRAFGPMFVAAAAILPLYVLVLHQVRNWYAVPAELSITLLASALCIDTLHHLAPTPDLSLRPWALALTGVLWLGAAWAEELAWPSQTWHPSYLRAAGRLVALTPETARIGAFNAGIVGAFASEGGRRVTNLDGVVNHGALRAINARTLTDYIDEQRIEFIADLPGTVAFEEQIAAPGLGARLDLLESVPIDGRPGESIGIWRVRPSR